MFAYVSYIAQLARFARFAGSISPTLASTTSCANHASAPPLPKGATASMGLRPAVAPLCIGLWLFYQIVGIAGYHKLLIGCYHRHSHLGVGGAEDEVLAHLVVAEAEVDADAQAFHIL